MACDSRCDRGGGIGMSPETFAGLAALLFVILALFLLADDRP